MGHNGRRYGVHAISQLILISNLFPFPDSNNITFIEPYASLDPVTVIVDMNILAVWCLGQQCGVQIGIV